MEPPSLLQWSTNGQLLRGDGKDVDGIEGRASAVYMQGPSYEPWYSAAFDRYLRSTDLCENRHVYLSGDGERAIWWTQGAWYLGSLKNVGKRSGFLTAKENTDVPEDVAVPWKAAAEGNQWHEAEGVKCITEAAHVDGAKPALAEAAGTIYMSGAAPGGVNATALGAYTLQADDAILNWRHVYVRADCDVGPLELWWTGGYWYVGLAKDVGSRRALLSCADNALLPTDIRNTWQVATVDGFVHAPDVKCSLTPGPPPAVLNALAAIQYVTMAMTILAKETSDDDTKSLAGSAKIATNSLRKAFDMFDVDQNGSLDADELLAILTRQTAQGHGMTLDDAKQLVAYFDTNGDGALDFNEFVEAISSIGTNNIRV